MPPFMVDPTTIPIPAETVDSGGTVSPAFGKLSVTNMGIDSETITATAADNANPTNLGTFSDTSNVGTPGSTFTEVDTSITDTPTNEILNRLQYVAPIFADGQSTIETLTITFASGDATPLPESVSVNIVTAPAITGTSGLSDQPDDGTTPIAPFNSPNFQIADTDFGNTATDTATIVVSDASGTPTDADGQFAAAPGVIQETGVGTGIYTIDEANPVAVGTLTSDLKNLVFDPVGGATGKTVTFALTVTDTGAGLTSKKDTNTSFITPAPPPGMITITDPNTVLQSDNDKAVTPFGNMVVGDTNATPMDTATITVFDPAGTPTDADGAFTLDNLLTKTGVGTYAITAAISPAALTTELESLVFTPVVGPTDKTTAFTVAVSDGMQTVPNSNVAILTIGTNPQPPDLVVLDNGKQISTMPPASPAEGPYSGPVAGLAEQYINLTPDNLIIKANTPNWFIHSGSGEDAIQADGGTNVLDGGTGSNFLVGGTSAGEFDTFFVDARGATADIWSTVVNFASGDNATMWGITPAMFNVAMVDNDGAANFTGLTFHATAPGAPEASLTLAGFTQADLASGKITQTFGTDPASGSAYMLLHAT